MIPLLGETGLRGNYRYDVYENGFDILRAGYIQAHNGIIARAR